MAGCLPARRVFALNSLGPSGPLQSLGKQVIHAGIALALAWLVGVATGDATLLMVLAASASYIAVPAVLRYAIPEANPSLYFGLSLGVTFALNMLLGIPAYATVARAVLG